jgi:uncharacterized repeat protein (TIGR03803 family)
MTPAGAVTELHDFGGGSDGAVPNILLQSTDGDFYGTTVAGGMHAKGTLFRMTRRAWSLLHVLGGEF